jgi:hypothetical protein
MQDYGEARPFTAIRVARTVGDAERVASEKFSQRIGQNIDQLESELRIGVTFLS